MASNKMFTRVKNVLSKHFKKRANPNESAATITDDFGFVHDASKCCYKCKVWITYPNRRRHFVKRLERFFDKELCGQIECLFQECESHLTEPDNYFMEKSLKAVSKYVVLFDANHKTDIGFNFQRSSAISSYKNKQYKCRMIFVKMDSQADLSDISTDNVNFLTLDFSRTDWDKEDLSKNNQIKVLIKELLEMTYEKDVDYLYAHPSLVGLYLNNLPESKSIAGVNVTFKSIDTDSAYSTFLIQKCNLSDQARDLVMNEESKGIFENIELGTVFSILPSPPTEYQLKFNASLLIFDQKFKNCLQKYVRVLHSDSISLVGAKWNDVTERSSLICGFPKSSTTSKSDALETRRGLCDGWFQYDSFQCGTYMICSTSVENSQIACAVANLTSKYMNSNFARLIVHYDDLPKYPLATQHLQLRCEIARLDTPVEYYGNYFQGVIVRLEDNDCYATMKYSCDESGNDFSFLHEFHLDHPEQSSFLGKLKYRTNWRFRVKFYSDKDHNNLLAKICTGSQAKCRKTWPPLNHVYSKCWTSPPPDLASSELSEFDLVEEAYTGVNDLNVAAARSAEADDLTVSSNDRQNGSGRYQHRYSLDETSTKTSKWTDAQIETWKSRAMSCDDNLTVDPDKLNDFNGDKLPVRSNSRQKFQQFFESIK
ncbi:uncharacterized protein LOC141899833 isoform X2 [Tubulanus polymorphus]|uniref:uncharacterized protein LOC141899833 isoform X2 n=1 Tax=Tubulanus polymorphus TaxID=672921 RepID=UPI003DA41C4B